MMEAAAFTSAPKGRAGFAAAFGETWMEGERALRSINWKLRRRRPRKSPLFWRLLCACVGFSSFMGESRRQTPIGFEPTRREKPFCPNK